MKISTMANTIQEIDNIINTLMRYEDMAKQIHENALKTASIKEAFTDAPVWFDDKLPDVVMKTMRENLMTSYMHHRNYDDTMRIRVTHIQKIAQNIKEIYTAIIYAKDQLTNNNVILTINPAIDKWGFTDVDFMVFLIKTFNNDADIYPKKSNNISHRYNDTMHELPPGLQQASNTRQFVLHTLIDTTHLNEIALTEIQQYKQQTIMNFYKTILVENYLKTTVIIMQFAKHLQTKSFEQAFEATFNQNTQDISADVLEQIKTRIVKNYDYFKTLENPKQYADFLHMYETKQYHLETFIAQLDNQFGSESETPFLSDTVFKTITTEFAKYRESLDTETPADKIALQNIRNGIDHELKKIR